MGKRGRKPKVAKTVPIVEVRKVRRQGGSYYISLPPEWFRCHGIKLPDKDQETELIIAANADIRIINPNKHKEIYDSITKIVEEGKPTTEEILKKLSESDEKLKKNGGMSNST